MGWLIIITIILAALITYFIYIMIAFKRFNYTRCYPEIKITNDKNELKHIC